MWTYIHNPAVVNKGYYLWKNNDGYWQLTKQKNPPASDSGYYNLNALLKLKGV